MFGKCLFHKMEFCNVHKFENFGWKSLRKFDAIKISLATTISFDHHHLLSVFVVYFFSWYEWLIRICIYTYLTHMHMTYVAFIYTFDYMFGIFALGVMHWLQYHYSIQTLCYVFRNVNWNPCLPCHCTTLPRAMRVLFSQSIVISIQWKQFSLVLIGTRGTRFLRSPMIWTFPSTFSYFTFSFTLVDT